MAETIIDYKIGADAEPIKRAMREAEASAQRLGSAIGEALARAGKQGTSDFSNNLDRGIRDAETRASRGGATIGAALGRGLALGVVAAGGGALTALKDEILEVGELAKKTGQAVEKLSALRNALASQGVSNSSFSSGVNDLGAKANKEFREGEGDLTELFEKNNLKLTDRNGKLKDINVLLADASTLIQNAATEFDKVEIAKLLGLSEDWVKALEKGPDALREAQRAAEETGNVITREMVQKAKDFDEAWNATWTSFATAAKAAIAGAAQGLAALISQAASFINSIGPKNPGNLQPLDAQSLQFGSAGVKIPEQFGPANPKASSDKGVNFGPAIPAGFFGKTTIPGKSKGGGGGGGGGLSDADRAENRLDQYTDSLKRQGDVLQAEIETFGKSNAERKAAIELAKAKVDLDRVDDETRKRLTEGITQAVAANENYRTSLEKLKGAQDAAKAVASSFSDALVEIAVDGKNAQDVVKSLGKSLLKDLLGGLLSGKGSFAGMFGTKESGGIFGSLLSGMFSGKFAGGGELPRGFSMVGENGPELLRNSGSGVSRVYPSGVGASGMSSGGGSVVINADFRGASDSAVAQISARLNQLQATLPKQIAAVSQRQQVRGYA